jgi:hypothetical protein
MFQEEAPVIHLVGHSRGGEMAFDAAFKEECAFVDDITGDLNFYEEQVPQANPLIGRVVTIGMPTSMKEMLWAQQAEKVQDVYNIVAKYDAIVSGASALSGAHAVVFDKGHLGILCPATYEHVKRLIT